MNIYISRLVASLVSSVVTWLATKYVIFNFLLDPENIEALVAITSGLVLAGYALVHKKLSQTTNPADTAKNADASATKLGL